MSSQNRQDSDNGLFVLLFMVFGMGLVYFLFTFYFGAVLELGFLQFKGSVGEKINILFNDKNLEEISEYTKTLNEESLDEENFWIISQYIGNKVRPAILIIFGILASMVIWKVKALNFRVNYNLKSFRNFQAKNWPIPKDPNPFNTTPALSPEEYCEKFGLIKKEELNEGKAEKELTAQLKFNKKIKFSSLPLYVRFFSCLFYLQTQGGKKEIDRLLKLGIQFNKKEKTIQKIVDGILNTKEFKAYLDDVRERFSWWESILLEMYVDAKKQGGVLPSSYFNWLKTKDRALWYGFNNEGRQTFHIEGVSLIAQWRFEKENGPNNEINIISAVEGLKFYLEKARLIRGTK